MREKMAKQAKNNENGAPADDPDDIARIVAKRLQEARKKAGLTQTQLGERAGVTQNYIYELEYGTTNISIRTLDKMAKALNADMRDFFPGSPLAAPSGADLDNLYRSLDELVARVRQHLAEEERLSERELARRHQSEAVLLGEIAAFSELRDGVGRLIKAGLEEKKSS